MMPPSAPVGTNLPMASSNVYGPEVESVLSVCPGVSEGVYGQV
jgi:hypothetical protein